MTGLTESQWKTWHIIRDFELRTWVQPNLREIQRECGFASANAARDAVERLERLGAVYVYRPETGGNVRVVALDAQ